MKHINLIQMLQGCSKRNGMTVSASMHDDGQNCNVKQRAELMSEDEKWSENGALSSTCLRSALVPLSLSSLCGDDFLRFSDEHWTGVGRGYYNYPYLYRFLFVTRQSCEGDNGK